MSAIISSVVLNQKHCCMMLSVTCCCFCKEFKLDKQITDFVGGVDGAGKCHYYINHSSRWQTEVEVKELVA